jgi:hypothetical protein
MNLNKNPRFENFEISDDEDFADYFEMVVDEIFDSPDVAEPPTTKQVDQKFKQMTILGESYDEMSLEPAPVDL